MHTTQCSVLSPCIQFKLVYFPIWLLVTHYLWLNNRHASPLHCFTMVWCSRDMNPVISGQLQSSPQWYVPAALLFLPGTFFGLKTWTLNNARTDGLLWQPSVASDSSSYCNLCWGLLHRGIRCHDNALCPKLHSQVYLDVSAGCLAGEMISVSKISQRTFEQHLELKDKPSNTYIPTRSKFCKQHSSISLFWYVLNWNPSDLVYMCCFIVGPLSSLAGSPSIFTAIFVF